MAVNGTPQWFPSDVGSPASQSYVSTPTLAFDHYGTPSVSWSSVSQINSTNFVYHSRLTGLGLWNTSTLASGVGQGLRTAVTFDRAERPTLGWVNNDGTVMASFDGGAAQNAGTGASFNNPLLSMSHDLAGNFRGFYSQAAAGNFFSLSFSSGTFSSASMTTFSGVTQVYDGAMVTDGRGLRQLATRVELSGGNHAVMVASEVPGGPGWLAGSLAAANEVKGVDIALDPADGHVALAYTTRDAGGTSRLFYSKFTGSMMQTTTISTSSSFRFEDVSLAFDLSDGRPAIAYERKNIGTGDEELFFGYRDANSIWQHSLVDGSILMEASGNKPRRPSLAFDDYGTSWPAIAYVDGDGSLNVAFDPPVPEPAMAALCAPLACLIARRRRRSR